MSAADPLEPGSLIAGRYRVGALLGHGGMASVHRARDEVLGREVALKAIVRSAADEAELQRERCEIDLLASLNHRALVTLFDAGRAALGAQTVSYLVMELVDGPTLAERLERGPLGERDATRMARDLAEALVVVHANGIVHRDIKPANVLLAPSPLPGREFEAKLADFGIASLVGSERLTATGTVLGTAAYLSPEQATGTRVGPASDVYSLGLVLLEAMTGRREYPGTLLESLSARLTRDPVVPGALGYHWRSLLTAMTARDPDARPTAVEVLERLTEPARDGALATAELSAGTVALAPPAAVLASPSPAPGAAADSTPAAPTLVLSGADAAETAPFASHAAMGTGGAHPAEDPAARRRRLGLAAALAVGAAVLVAVPAMALHQVDPLKAAVEFEALPEQPAVEAVPVEVTTSAQPVEPAPAPAPAPVTTPVEPPGADQGNGAGAGNGGGGEGNGGQGAGNGGANGNGNRP